jgi:hypothetical protein
MNILNTPLLSLDFKLVNHFTNHVSFHVPHYAFSPYLAKYLRKYLHFLHPRVRNIITITFQIRPSSHTFLMCLFLLSYFKHYMFRLYHLTAICVLESWVTKTPEDGREMLQPKHVVFKVR